MHRQEDGSRYDPVGYPRKRDRHTRSNCALNAHLITDGSDNAAATSFGSFSPDAANPAEIRQKVTERLEQEDIGLQLMNIAIQDSEPPTEEVQQAFTAVETAKQSADTAVNNAKKYANEVIPAAQADADEIIKKAEARKESRINEAKGQAARFSELYSEYMNYPLITKQRLFYEAMEEILPEMRLYIIDAETGTQTMLPLDSFMGTEG